MPSKIRTIRRFYIQHVCLHYQSNPTVSDEELVSPVVAATGSAIGCLIIIVVVVIMIFKKRNDKKRKEWIETLHTDENRTYGTYARGWDGEGEYGDGDRVYAEDKNVYYVRNADY